MNIFRTQHLLVGLYITYKIDDLKKYYFFVTLFYKKGGEIGVF